MNHQNYSRWFLAQHHNSVEHCIPVQLPTHKDKIEGLPGKLRGVTSAAFLCPDCGLVSLYSESDADSYAVETPDPYALGLYDLFYIEVGCDGSNCESLTRIHVIRDEKTKTYLRAKPMSEWVVEDSVKCKNGHSLKIDPDEDYEFYRCLMPF